MRSPRTPSQHGSWDSQKLAEKVLSPSGRFVATHQRSKTSSGVGFGNRQSGEIDQGGPDVAVERHLGQNAALLGFWKAWIIHHEGDAQRLFVMGPLASESAIAEIIAIVGGVQDDRIVSQPLLFELFCEAAYDMVDSADHSKVGPHVGFGTSPRYRPTTYRIALPVDRLLQEIGLGFVDRRLVERGERHPLAFVHAVGDLGPWIMSDARPLVAVFGMSGVETDLQAEGLIFRLLLEEIDRPVSRESYKSVTRRSIGLFFEKRLPTDSLPHGLPHESGGFACNADQRVPCQDGRL